jgi:D-erythrulose 1-phosphate 3-epimerase
VAEGGPNIAAGRIGIRDLQLTHEYVNPAWPPATVAKTVRRFRAALARTGVRVTSAMTGPYGRLNHFGHPDPEVRRYYVDWFRTFADIAGELGARAIGTQFAILAQSDQDDPVRRAERSHHAFFGHVLVVLMSAGLVIAIWGIAEGRLVDIFSSALDTVCGGIGC